MKVKRKTEICEAEQYNGPICFPKDGPVGSLPAGVELRAFDISWDRYPVLPKGDFLMPDLVSPGDWVITDSRGIRQVVNDTGFRQLFQVIEA